MTPRVMATVDVARLAMTRGVMRSASVPLVTAGVPVTNATPGRRGYNQALGARSVREPALLPRLADGSADLLARWHATEFARGAVQWLDCSGDVVSRQERGVAVGSMGAVGQERNPHPQIDVGVGRSHHPFGLRMHGEWGAQAHWPGSTSDLRCLCRAGRPTR